MTPVEGQPTFFLNSLARPPDKNIIQDVKVEENFKFESDVLASKRRSVIPILFFIWNHIDVVSTFTDGCAGRKNGTSLGQWGD